jgi:HD-GYP domain-containing protein (c-di-GMP phosphodiesterase class II)
VEISGEILQKPGGLTEDEYTDMQDHPALGEIMLEGIPFLNEARALIRHHHERWDGRGYPDGLQGDAIPLGARVIAIADVYDALTLHRSYRQGTSKERAILHLRREKGSRLDPYLVEVFITVLQETA